MIDTVMPTYGARDIAFEKGEGIYLFDTAGRRFMDCGSGIAVTSVGHSHPHLVAAMKDQIEKVWHTSNLYNIPGQMKAADQDVRSGEAFEAYLNGELAKLAQ